MSVKDRIAMWNNMANNNNSTTTNNAPKVTTSTFVPKPSPAQQIQQMRASENVTNKHQVQPVTIVKPSELKKKQLEQGQTTNKLPQYVAKPTQPTYKAPEPVKKETPQTNTLNISTQSPTIQKPSDIKKNLQQRISNNNFHIIAPQAHIKKVESVTIEQKQDSGAKAGYEIERDVPTLSVKENAQKLGLFYQKKNEQLNKPKEVVPVVEEQQEIHHEQRQQEQHSQTHITQQHHQTVHHEERTAPKEEEKAFILPPQNEATVPQQQTQQKQQQITQETDLAVRLKNRKQKRRVNFDSDDD